MHLLKLVMYKTVNVFKFPTCPFTVPLVFQTSEKRTSDYIFLGAIMLTQNAKITQSKKNTFARRVQNMKRGRNVILIV